MEDFYCHLPGMGGGSTLFSRTSRLACEKIRASAGFIAHDDESIVPAATLSGIEEGDAIAVAEDTTPIIGVAGRRVQ